MYSYVISKSCSIAYCKSLKLSFCLNHQTEHKGQGSEKKRCLNASK